MSPAFFASLWLIDQFCSLYFVLALIPHTISREYETFCPIDQFVEFLVQIASQASKAKHNIAKKRGFAEFRWRT
jgi:hypothetical protein